MEIQNEMNLTVISDEKDKMTIIQATGKENPKPEDVEALDKLFDQNPYIWQQVGNVAARVK